MTGSDWVGAASHVGRAATADAGRVLLVTDNGHGLGHLTRMLALARRFGGQTQVRFATCSRAHPIIEAAGFPTDYIVSYQESGASWTRWAAGAEKRLEQVVRDMQPDVLVIDHVRPWRFLARLKQVRPGLKLVWCRRGLWREGRNLEILDRSGLFDLILEPLDLASLRDRGGTTHEAGAVRVPPVTLLDRDEALDRVTARRELGLPADGLCAVVQLSADDSGSLERQVARVADSLGEQVSGATLFTPRHPLHPTATDRVGAVRSAPVYPLSRYYAAFDLAVSTAGYNTFHELVVAGLPTLFVARDTETLDDQNLRASRAPQVGFGQHVPDLDDGAALATELGALIDPVARRRMRAAAAELVPVNGAWAAVEQIASISSSASLLEPRGEERS